MGYERKSGVCLTPRFSSLNHHVLPDSSLCLDPRAPSSAGHSQSIRYSPRPCPAPNPRLGLWDAGEASTSGLSEGLCWLGKRHLGGSVGQPPARRGLRALPLGQSPQAASLGVCICSRGLCCPGLWFLFHSAGSIWHLDIINSRC